MNQVAIYEGEFGRCVADQLAQLAPFEVLALQDCNISGMINQSVERAVVVLSDLSSKKLGQFAELFAASNITWTSVYAGPSHVRIGPKVNHIGCCFECGTRRYLAAGPEEAITRIEQLAARSGNHAEAFSAKGHLATFVVSCAAEALRQLNDTVTAGTIRVINVVDLNITQGVALPIHGCSCAQPAGPQRFVESLQRDFKYLWEEAQL